MRKIDLTQTHAVLNEYHQENYDDIAKKYHDPGTQYCFDVLNQKVIAGYLIQLACFRHLQDLKRVEEQQSDFKYHYDLNKCKKILKFASICPDVDTGKPVALMDWQKFILTQLMGWRDENGHKRFTNAIVSVARGQGKTFFASIIAAYSYLIETLGLSNQDLLVTSINYKQSGKLFGYIQTMLKKIIQIPPFDRLASKTNLDLRIYKDDIIEKATNNILRLISYESGQYDSFHFKTAVFDEIGEITNRSKTSKITSGQVKVTDHQFIQISTAYPDPSAPFHEDEKTFQSLMERDFDREGDNNLCLVWCQDSLDETFKPETWAKSNPLLNLPSQHDTLLKGLIDERNSKSLSGILGDFQNKNMNMWLQEATNSYLKLSDVEKTTIDDFDMHNRKVYVGIDYSMMSDNTAIAFVVPYTTENGENKFYLAQHSFIPWYKAGSIEAKEKQDGLNYRELAKQGYCTITSHPQGLIDDDQVYQWLINYVEDNNLQVVFFGYDAYGVTKVIKALESNTTWALVAIRQRTSELAEPTKFLQKCFVEDSATHLDDKVLEKALLNAQLKEDRIGIQVDKAKATLKIDVVDALIDAMYQAEYSFDDFKKRDSSPVDRMTAEDVKKWFEDESSGLI